MTMIFRPTLDDFKLSPIGEDVTLNAIGIAGDKEAQALLIQSKLDVRNKYPHITIAHSDNVKPKYSNEMFENISKEVNYGTAPKEYFTYAGDLYLFQHAIPLQAKVGWSKGYGEPRYDNIFEEVNEYVR